MNYFKILTQRNTFPITISAIVFPFLLFFMSSCSLLFEDDDVYESYPAAPTSFTPGDTFKAEYTLYYDSSITIPSGTVLELGDTSGIRITNGTLTLEEGVTFIMGQSAQVIVTDGGRIVSNGTEKKPVSFLPHKGNSTWGRWRDTSFYGGISISKTADSANIFRNTHIKKASSGMYCAANRGVIIDSCLFDSIPYLCFSFEDSSAIAVSHSTFRSFSEYYGFELHGNSINALDETNSLTSTMMLRYPYITGGVLSADSIYLWGNMTIGAPEDGSYSPVTIAAGTLLKWEGGLASSWNAINVRNGGSVHFEGSSEKPIKIVGCKTMSIDSTAGEQSSFRYVDVRFNAINHGDPEDGIHISQKTGVSISNCEIAGKYGVHIDSGCSVEIDSTKFATFKRDIVLSNTGLTQIATSNDFDEGIEIGTVKLNKGTIPGCPIKLHSLKITSSAVTITAGAELNFSNRIDIEIDSGGSLSAVGTASQPIFFQGNKPHWSDYSAAIRIDSTAGGNNRFEYCLIHTPIDTIFSLQKSDLTIANTSIFGYEIAAIALDSASTLTLLSNSGIDSSAILYH